MIRWSDARVPGAARRLLFALLAALAPTVAASPAGAAGHITHPPGAQPDPNVGIVDIYTRLGYRQGEAAGTGLILTRSGEVLTNNHVIDGATSFRVVDVTTHRRYTATVVGYSVRRDVAVLQLAHASGLRPISLGRPAQLRVGQAVVVRGNALGRGKPAATAGTVTALHRRIVAGTGSGGSETLSNLIVTSARVQPGESGGALQNARGQTIGMVTAGSTGAGHRGYAIPITQALGVAGLIEAGTSTGTVHVGPTASLGRGVVLQNVAGGARVVQVPPGSAAAAAGLVAGDVVTSLNGAAVSTQADVRRVLLALVPGTAVSLGWTDTTGSAQAGTLTPASGPPQ